MIQVKIRARMGELGMNQAQLAEITGIRANTVNGLYHDLSDRVSLDHLERICVALKCDLHEILVYTPDVELQRKKRYPKKPE